MVKDPLANAVDLGWIPGSGRSPGGGNGNPLQYSCLKNPHRQRSLAGYSPWGRKESETTEQLSTASSHAWCVSNGVALDMCSRRTGLPPGLRTKSGVIVNTGTQLWMDKDPDWKSGRVTGRSIQFNWFLISWASTGCNWGIQLCWRGRDSKQPCSFSSKWLYLGSLHPYHKNCASLSHREKFAWAGVNSILLSLILPF